MKVYSSSGWTNAGSSVNGTAERFTYTATAAQTTFTGADDNTNTLAYDAGFLDVYMNGVKLVNGSDFTATSGSSIVLASGAAANDTIEIIAYGTFTLSNQSINDMTDVSTSGVANNSILAYNSTNSQFEPTDAPTFASITVTGNVDGRDVSADGTKLDTIETNADVTDATNVAAAGAAMTSGATFTGDVSFGDNDKAIFGAGNDLQIYHDEYNSYIEEQGTGNLFIRGTNHVYLQNSAGTKTYFAGNDPSGWVRLYHDNNKKFETTSTGIDVAGDVGADTATITGTVTAGQYDSTEALPDIRPSLLLDFANSKTLDPRITFTRGSTATYWDGKTTTKAEENLITYSQELRDATYTNGGVVFTENDTTAPDGTTTADKVTFTSQTTSRFYQIVPNQTGGYLTFSFYAKYVDKQWISIRISESAAGTSGIYLRTWFDLNNGVVGTDETNSATMTSVGNGWYRCTVTSEHQVLNDAFLIRGAAADNATSNVAAAGDVYFWGLQAEQRDAATTYTPTTSSPIVKYQPTLQTAASNEARFDHDPVTGESKGLLIEEAKTNLVLQSENLASGSWSKVGLRKFYDAAISPDGTLTADWIQHSNSTQTHYFYQTVSVNTNARYTYSAYVKKPPYSPSSSAVFNWGSASVTIDFTGDDPSFSQATGYEHVGNGWWRFWKTFTAPSATINTYVYADSGRNEEHGFVVWGLQLEDGYGASAYIPTTSSTVTRSADDASIALTNEVSLQEATVYAEAATYRAFTAETAWCPVWQLNNGSNTSDGVFDVRAYQITHGSMAVAQGISGSTDLLKDSQTVTNGEFYKYGLFWDKGSVSFYKNGTLVNSTTNQYANPSWDSLDIGWADRGGRKLDGHIKKLSVYPQALSSNTMIAITEA